MGLLGAGAAGPTAVHFPGSNCADLPAPVPAHIASCYPSFPPLAPWFPNPASLLQPCPPPADLLGSSLWDIWNQEGQQLTAQYVACVAVEALHILEALHAKG